MSSKRKVKFPIAKNGNMPWRLKGIEQIQNQTIVHVSYFYCFYIELIHSFPQKTAAFCFCFFFFLRKLLRWILIILSQSLMTELCLREGSARPQQRSDMAGCRRRGDGTLCWMLCMEIHFFFSAFCADLVTFPPDAAFFSTDLMTPTATVCLMSRTAKRPVKGRWTQEGH